MNQALAAFNPIVVADPLILLIPVAFYIEYLVVKALIGKWLPRGKINTSFLWININTFIPMMILAYYIGLWAELVPMALEPLLYGWVARRAGVLIPQLAWRIIAANMASFLFGLAAVYLILAAIRGM